MQVPGTRALAVIAAGTLMLGAGPRAARAAGTHTLLNSFTAAYTSGYDPRGGLVKAADGNFYGTTYATSGGYGAIYRITPTGVLTILHAFITASGYPEGLYPYGTPVAEGPAGSITLYGTCTIYGGAGMHGTVWKYEVATDTLTVLHAFAGGAGDGHTPYSGLAKSGSTLYGVTYYGGAANQGVAYKVNTDGSGFAVLKEFTSASSGEYYPYGAPIVAGGKLYGTCRYGGGGVGSGANGALWRMDLDGSNYTKLHAFNGYGAPSSTGAEPMGDLSADATGNVYGTCRVGGYSHYGTVFKYTTGGALQIVHSFNGLSGAFTQSPVCIGSDGKLYVTTYEGGSAGYGTLVSLANAPAGAAKVLTNFDGYSVLNPDFGVVQGANGPGSTLNFFGVSQDGGLTTPYPGHASGYGAVYKTSVTSTTSTTRLLYSFYVRDSYYPYSELVLNPKDGCYYGTTHDGGALGWGTIYKIDPAGNRTTIHHFNDYLEEGTSPRGGICLARDGALYGLTNGGGRYGHGTFFKCTTAGVLTVLRQMHAPSGYFSYSQLIQGAGTDNNFYGVTQSGGPSNWGIVFKVSPSGVYAALRVFSAYDGLGYDPYGKLYQDPVTKRLWGTCANGGVSNAGVLFSMKTDGTGYTVHYAFSSAASGPYNPYGGVVRGLGSNVYGTTYNGGSTGGGVIYRYDTTKTDATGFAIVHHFPNTAGIGRNPYLHELAFVNSASNTLFGTTRYGGTGSRGTVFSYDLDTSTFATEYQFDGTGAGFTGANPEAGVVVGPDCKLYGTIHNGGSHGLGNVYSLDTGLEHGVAVPGTDIAITSTKTNLGGGHWTWKV